MKRLPDKSIRLIVTDPPYGLNYNDGEDLAKIRERAFGGDKSKMKPRPIEGDGEVEALELFKKFLIEAKRLLTPNGGCCCCCGGGGPKPLFAQWTLLMDKYLRFKHAVVWDKGGLGMGFHYRRNYEFMLVAQRGNTCIWNGGNTTSNVFRLGKIIPSAEQHPTIKPIELMEHFIRLHSNEGDTILDPFAGSFTTAIAAIRLKRNFICIEKKLAYVKIGRQRIKNEISQLKLF